MPFKSIEIPLFAGIRKDLTDLATGSQALQECTNAVFNEDGAITVRPGETSEDGPVLSLDGPTSLANLAAVTQEKLAVLPSPYGPLLQTAGKLFCKKGGTWVEAGPHWSTKASYSDLLGDFTTVDPRLSPSVGSSIVGYFGNNPKANYFDISRGAPITSTVLWAATDSRCAAGDALFCTSGANLLMLSGYPTQTSVTLATDALTTAGTAVSQRVWAVSHASGYYVAYIRSGSTRFLKLSLAGAVQASVSVSAGAWASSDPGRSVAIAANSTLLMAVTTDPGGTASLESKVFDIATWADLSRDGSASFSLGQMSGAVCGIDTSGTGWASSYTTGTSSGDVHVFTRSLSSASGLTSVARIYGSDSTVSSGFLTPPQVKWRTLFPPTEVNGRMLLGVQHRPGQGNGGSFHTASTLPGTWMVLDVTSPSRLSVAAAGEEGLCLAQASPGACTKLPDGSLSFAVLEGLRFDTEGVKDARARQITLKAVQAATTQCNGDVLFSGTYPYCFDGVSSFPLGYPVAPEITAMVVPSSGSLDPGSRSVACCWVFVDAQGNEHRSAPSNTVTLTLPTLASIQVKSTLPQWLRHMAPQSYKLELYITVANPSESADKFLVASEIITTLAASSQTISVAADDTPPLIERLPLYTGGGILPNEPAPANSGIVTVGSRVWCASDRAVFASKLITPGQGPSWSTEGSLTLNISSEFGKVMGLAGFDNTLFVLCQKGALAFTGDGPTDVGGLSDFRDPRLVYTAPGPALPCDVTSLPVGNIWTTSFGDAHAISPSGQGSKISDPVATLKLSRPHFVAGSGKTNDVVLFVTPTDVAMFDVPSGQWGTWKFASPVTSIASVGVEPFTYRSGVFAIRDGVPDGAVLTVKTSLFPLGSLGRIKAVKPRGLTTDVDGVMTVEVAFDQAQTVVSGNTGTLSLAPTTTQWPRSDMPEFRCGVQRCESFSVRLTITPGVIRLTGLECLVMSSDTNPRNQRA